MLQQQRYVVLLRIHPVTTIPTFFAPDFALDSSSNVQDTGATKVQLYSYFVFITNTRTVSHKGA